MAQLIKLQETKSYVSEKNVIKAVEKMYPDQHDGLTYFIQKTDSGRFFPVFIGMRALNAMVHFNFHVVA